MKLLHRLLCHTSINTLVAVLATSAMVAAPVSANDANTSPVSIQAVLVTPALITLGEPVLVHYDVTNISGQTMALQMGLRGTDWYTITLRDAQGHGVPAVPIRLPESPSGAFSTQDGFYHNGVGTSGYIPVSKIIAIPRSGNYTLTIHVNLAYALTGASESGWSETWTAKSGLRVTRDITFPILVTQADDVRLRAKAEALRKAVNSPATEGKLCQADMAVLFSMPEAQASPVWRELALKPNVSNDLVAGELEDLHSKVGVDLLAEMLDTTGLSCTPVSDRLNALYNSGDATMREYIRGVALRHGFMMPEVAATPVSLD